MTLQDGSDELLGVDGLKVDSITYKAGQIDVGAVAIHNPRGHATRNADGMIEVAGTRLNPTVLLAASAKSPAHPTTAPSTQPFVATLKQLALDNAQLHWTDNAVTPVVNTTAYVTANVNELTVGRHAAPATFSLQVACDGVLDNLKVDGEQLDLTPGAELAKMTVTADGVRGARWRDTCRRV